MREQEDGLRCRICGERAEDDDLTHAGVCWDCEKEHDADGAERILALAAEADLDPLDLEISSYDDALVTCGTMEYLVLSDEEANERAREDAEDYAVEFLLGEIPERYHAYVDTDQFVADVLQHDGRGSVLSSYDGSEWDYHDPITPIRDVEYIRTDGWRGYDQPVLVDGYVVVADGWATDAWDDVPYKHSFNDLIDAMQCGTLVPPVDVYVIACTTSNVFSMALDVVVAEADQDALETWLATEAQCDLECLQSALS